MPLRFIRHGEKLYAKTPGGEYAYGDSQGLYEWRDRLRIDHSGGDRQGSSDGRLWTASPYPEPMLRGIREAVMNRARLN